MVFCCVFLSGCTGDTLSFRHQGDARIKNNGICIKTSPDNILEFYLLSSSLDNYQKPLVLGDGIAKKHPDTCIKADLKKAADYDLMYMLNGKNID